MNNRESVESKILEFLNSSNKSLLITGTNQYEKHKLVMSIINSNYKNANILFRINSMNNISDASFIGLNKIPICGKKVKIGNNYYEFDTFNNKGTWVNTSYEFDFAILYPIDALCRSMKKDAIVDLFECKNIKKIFLCSWTDKCDYDYSKFKEFFSHIAIYDAEEEDIEYHKRVLNNIN